MKCDSELKCRLFVFVLINSLSLTSIVLNVCVLWCYDEKIIPIVY